MKFVHIFVDILKTKFMVSLRISWVCFFVILHSLFSCSLLTHGVKNEIYLTTGEITFKALGLVELSELQDVSKILVKALVLMAQQKHMEKVHCISTINTGLNYI